MVSKTVVVLSLVVAACAALNLRAPAINRKLINEINSNPNATWVAGVNDHFFGWNMKMVKKLMGVIRSNRAPLPQKLFESVKDIPDSFDARDQWGTMCPSMSEVRDQAACGSCWAFGAVEAMTDRICISSAGKNMAHLSAADMLSCCGICGFGCDGGEPSSAWEYWVESGVVSGGNYGTGQGCYPYQIPSCDHHVNGTLPPCGNEVPTPPCVKKCQNGAVWKSDKHFGASAYSISSTVSDIQTEIMTNGPVEADFTVYEDFLAYKSGVYQHTSGEELGGHAIKILGWGTDSGTDYWIVANSWNADWGNKGFFNILRGQDECGIEDDINAGLPKN